MKSAHRQSVVSVCARRQQEFFVDEADDLTLKVKVKDCNCAVRKHYDHEGHLGREFDPDLWQEPVRNSRGPECRRCSFDSDDEDWH